MPRNTNWRPWVRARLRRLGSIVPNLVTLPGGALIALVVLTLQHRVWIAARVRRTLATVLAFASGIMSR
jgi:hypothetical protein